MTRLDNEAESFRTALARAIVRCEHLLHQQSAAGALRDSKRPPFDYFGLESLPLHKSERRLIRRLLVQAYLEQRDANLSVDTDDTIRHARQRGRLLVFMPEYSCSEGLAVDETDGLIDEHYCPAWGTWVWQDDTGRESILFSWIPTPFVPAVSNGIAVDPLQSLMWADSPEARRALDSSWLLQTLIDTGLVTH